MQGLAALETHFRKSRIVCDKEDYLPVAFEPARNGLNQTFVQSKVLIPTRTPTRTPRHREITAGINSQFVSRLQVDELGAGSLTLNVPNADIAPRAVWWRSTDAGTEQLDVPWAAAMFEYRTWHLLYYKRTRRWSRIIIERCCTRTFTQPSHLWSNQ